MTKRLRISGRSFDFEELQLGIWYCNCTRDSADGPVKCMLVYLECKVSDLGQFFNDEFDGPTLLTHPNLFQILRHADFVLSAYSCIPPVTTDLSSIRDRMIYGWIPHHLVLLTAFHGNSSLVYSLSHQLPLDVKQ